MHRVSFLVGPTASGKTALSLRIAPELKAEIISADSRQVYRHLNIGTAKPTLQERALVPHHFVDCLEPDQAYSAGEYGSQARVKIEELFTQGITPLVVGGSGLYISALVDDFFTGPSADPEIRQRLRERAKREGVEILYSELHQIDPSAAQKILPGDYRRIERALEIFFLTGVPISEMRRQKANPPLYQPIIVGLEWPRDQLYARLNQRCLQMLAEGLVEEVQLLLEEKGLTPETSRSLDSVGYHEVIQYLRQDVDYTEMIRLFQRNTRRFAKRQIAWFKREARIHWVQMDQTSSSEAISARVLEVFKRN